MSSKNNEPTEVPQPEQALRTFDHQNYIFGATVRAGKSRTIRLARLKSCEKFNMVAHKYNLSMISDNEKEELLTSYGFITEFSLISFFLFDFLVFSSAVHT